MPSLKGNRGRRKRNARDGRLDVDVQQCLHSADLVLNQHIPTAVVGDTARTGVGVRALVGEAVTRAGIAVNVRGLRAYGIDFEYVALNRRGEELFGRYRERFLFLGHFVRVSVGTFFEVEHYLLGRSDTAVDDILLRHDEPALSAYCGNLEVAELGAHRAERIAEIESYLVGRAGSQHHAVRGGQLLAAVCK